MSDPDTNDAGANASGSQSGDSAQTWDSVDSGQSEDIENSLTGQGYSDRETTEEADETEDASSDAAHPVRGVDRKPGGGGGGGGL